MIKVETLGMIEIAKSNPVLTRAEETKNYSFITEGDDLYLVANTIVGDDAYNDDAVIPANEYLNGFLVSAWLGQNLIVDQKHVKDASSINADDILEKDTDGSLKKNAEATGLCFKVLSKDVRLTGPAFKVKVIEKAGE